MVKKRLAIDSKIDCRNIICVFGSAFDIIDSDKIDSDRIDYNIIDFERIDLCLDTIM